MDRFAGMIPQGGDWRQQYMAANPRPLPDPQGRQMGGQLLVPLTSWAGYNPATGTASEVAQKPYDGAAWNPAGPAANGPQAPPPPAGWKPPNAGAAAQLQQSMGSSDPYGMTGAYSSSGQYPPQYGGGSPQGGSQYGGGSPGGQYGGAPQGGDAPAQYGDPYAVGGRRSQPGTFG